MPERNLDSWNLMISRFASNGKGDDGLQLFEQMRERGHVKMLRLLLGFCPLVVAKDLLNWVLAISIPCPKSMGLIQELSIIWP